MVILCLVALVTIDKRYITNDQASVFWLPRVITKLNGDTLLGCGYCRQATSKYLTSYISVLTLKYLLLGGM